MAGVIFTILHEFHIHHFPFLFHSLIVFFLSFLFFFFFPFSFFLFSFFFSFFFLFLLSNVTPALSYLLLRILPCWNGLVYNRFVAGADR
jgi:hypothetical protein